MNWIKRIMNKLFIDNESYNIEEDNITCVAVKLFYVTSKTDMYTILISFRY